jgi:hypothetical protein
VQRIMACGAAAVLVVCLLAGCGSDGGNESIGTGSKATLHGYCTALLRMNRELGSLAEARATLDDKAKARQSIAYLRDVQDHAPGELAAIWQDVIDGYQELAIVEQTDRDEMIRSAAKRAVSELPAGASSSEAWAAIGKAGQQALDADEKADAPHERRADQLLRHSVSSALGSARGACGLTWTKG